MTTKTSIFIIDIQNDLAGPPTEIPNPYDPDLDHDPDPDHDHDTKPKTKATITTTPIPAAERIVSEAETILRDVRDLVARFRARNIVNNNGGGDDIRPPIEIVFVQHEDLPGKGTLRRGSWAWELVSCLRPLEGEGEGRRWGDERVVEKRTRMFFFSFFAFSFSFHFFFHPLSESFLPSS